MAAPLPTEIGAAPSPRSEVRAALSGLGYGPDEVRDVLAGLNGGDDVSVEELLRVALKQLAAVR